MKIKFLLLITTLSLTLGSCVSKKKYLDLQSQLEMSNKGFEESALNISKLSNRLSACEQEKAKLTNSKASSTTEMKLRQEQIRDLKEQIRDIRIQRDKQLEQVGELTVLSQSATNNIDKTLAQLEKKDEYIHLIQAAKTKADSINLALAVNLKGVLNDGISDQDIDVQVDKTVVFVNLSDKMTYQSGSASITPRAKIVLGKIAQIIKSRPDLEVMVEGYTDSRSIKNSCIEDNWDLSVKRATAVVRVLQNEYQVDPNRMIAAGRGEYNALASNETEFGRTINRRTRIIILPKLDQFYDLLDPNKVPK